MAKPIIEGRPSPAALREMYWGAEKPSRRMLADRLGVAFGTIDRWLQAAGVSFRTVGEQRRLDFALGRRGPSGCATAPSERRAEIARAVCARRSAESWAAAAQRLNAPAAARQSALAHTRPVVRPCGWCGEPVRRTDCRAKRAQRFMCSLSHNTSHRNHIRYHPTEPRPLILAQLVERMAELRKQGLPIGAATMQKAAEPIGASGIELEAYLVTLTPREMDEYLDNQLEHDVRAAGL